MRQWRKDIEAEHYERDRDYLEATGHARHTFEHGPRASLYYKCERDEDGWHSWPARFVECDYDLGARRNRGAKRAGFGARR